MNAVNAEKHYAVILSPYISEKAVKMTDKQGAYAFCVAKTATKLDVKKAIEFLFNVQVEQVHIVNVKEKRKLFKGKEGKRKGWKKAYITLQGEQKLDIIGMQ